MTLRSIVKSRGWRVVQKVLPSISPIWALAGWWRSRCFLGGTISCSTWIKWRGLVFNVNLQLDTFIYWHSAERSPLYVAPWWQWHSFQWHVLTPAESAWPAFWPSSWGKWPPGPGHASPCGMTCPGQPIAPLSFLHLLAEWHIARAAAPEWSWPLLLHHWTP